MTSSSEEEEDLEHEMEEEPEHELLKGKKRRVGRGRGHDWRPGQKEPINKIYLRTTLLKNLPPPVFLCVFADEPAAQRVISVTIPRLCSLFFPKHNICTRKEGGGLLF